MKPKFFILAEHVLHLPSQDAGLQNSIVRLHNSWIGKKGAKDKVHRRQAVVIENPNTKTRIIRNVLGAHPAQPIASPKSIMIDYDAKVELGWDETHLLNVYPATAFQVYHWYWDHPDTGYRVASRLGIWGLILGVIGLVFGVVTLFL